MSVLIYSRNMRHDCYILCHVSSNTDRFFLLCLQDTAVVYISTVFWYNLTQTGFCETLLNTHLFVCKRKRLHVSLYSPETSLTIPTRFPHFSASHLFFLSSASSFSLCFSPHLSPSLASYTCRLMCFAKSLRAGDDITWYFYYLKLERVRCQLRATPILSHHPPPHTHIHTCSLRCLLLILSRVSG